MSYDVTLNISANDISQTKAMLRRQLRAVRAGIDPSRASAAAAEIAIHLCAAIGNQIANKIVAGYWPLAEELDPRPVMEALSARGADLALPADIVADHALAFRAWALNDPLQIGSFGISTPEAAQPIVVPDIVLVPLLAFDKDGYRLGFGGGFYDRTIALFETMGHKPLLIGLAFAAQEMPKLPRENHDRSLDMIVTEEGLKTWPR